MAVQSNVNNSGGQYNAAFAGGNTETLIYTGSGLVGNFVITAAGTAVVSIYDGTQSTGGTLIYTSITNDVTGTIKTINMPFTTGLVIKGTTGSATAAVGYFKSGVYGL